jgi:hypothetical protein
MYPFTALQAGLMMLAGVLWVSLPSEVLPSLEWRLHFGIAMFAFGMMSGVATGAWLSRRAPGQESP